MAQTRFTVNVHVCEQDIATIEALTVERSGRVFYSFRIGDISLFLDSMDEVKRLHAALDNYITAPAAQTEAA